MLSDFEMIVKHFPDRQDIKIIPVSDVHLCAMEQLETEWEQFCQSVLKDENVYLTLGGDLLDNGIRTSIANPFEQKYRPSVAKKMMVEMLDPLRSRVLCAVCGNHEARSRDADDDPMYDIMCKLDIEDLYRENMAFLKVQIGDLKGCGLKNPTYMFCNAHGGGSSIYTGAAASKSERFGMAIDGIDCLIVGHTHKPGNFPVGKLRVDTHNNIVKVAPWRLVVSTSWLGYAGYAGRKLLPPTAFAPQEIRLCGKYKELKVLQ